MRKFLASVAICNLVVSLMLPMSQATTLEVTHSPAPGQFDSISAAINSANSGDVIEIVDNSSPFEDHIAIDGSLSGLEDLTIQGAQGLNPRPVLQGPTVPQSPPWSSGTTSVLSYQSLPRLQIKHLRIDARGAMVAVDAREDGELVLTDCEVFGAANNSILSQGPAQLVGCHVRDGIQVVEHLSGGPLEMNNTQLVGGSVAALAIRGGTVTLESHCYLESSAAGTVNVDNTSSDPINLTMSETLIRNTSTAPNNLVVFQASNTANLRASFEHCDFIGGGGNVRNSQSGAALLIARPVESLSVTHSIFYNLSIATFAVFESPSGIGEDYNLYKFCSNNMLQEGGNSGGHSREIGEQVVLYLQPLSGDYRLFDNSPATTLPAPGSPPWYGSCGPGGISAEPGVWLRNQDNLLQGMNIYNPCLVDVGDPVYPYRMFFFGWATEICNPGYSGCDATYLARSKDMRNWEVYTGTDNWDTTNNTSTWVPVISAQDEYYDEWHNGDPAVVYRDGTFYMAYSATGFDQDRLAAGQPGDTDGDILCVMGAKSSNGIDWQKSLAPIVICATEIGVLEDTSDPSYTGMYHRPSLMWAGTHWRLWFDYWVPGPLGIGMGYAECHGDFLDPSDWVVMAADQEPLLNNWPNPNVTFYDGQYHSFADPVGYPGGTGWTSRQIEEATSTDGLNWTRLGFLDPDPDAAANQIPEAFITTIDGLDWMYLFYGAQTGGEPYDYTYKRIRAMRRLMSKPATLSISNWKLY